MRYARIEHGKVVEIGEFPSIEGRFHESLVWVECGADVQVAYAYDGVNFTPPPPSLLLAESKIQKYAELSAACHKAITGGFISAALGSTYRYDSDVREQDNIQHAKETGFDAEIKCTNAAGVKAFVIHSAAQIAQVHADMVAHILAQRKRYDDKKVQVKNATNVADVEAVVW